MSINRRKFINSLLGIGLLGWIGSALYPILSFLKPPKVQEPIVNSVKAGMIDAFPPDSAQIIKFGRTPVLLVRTDVGQFIALQATCTHLDCIVQYRSDTKHIFCACHNGVYDLKGRNISGPPPKPLEEYAVNVINNEIIVSKQKQVS